MGHSESITKIGEAEIVKMVEIVLGWPWDWIIWIGLICCIAAWILYKFGMKIIIGDLFQFEDTELKILMKLYDNGYDWICRDYNGKLYAYRSRPKRTKIIGSFYKWEKAKSLDGREEAYKISRSYFINISRFSKKPHKIEAMLNR